MPVGPEASIFTFFIGSAIGIYLLTRAAKTGNFVPAFGKKS